MKKNLSRATILLSRYFIIALLVQMGSFSILLGNSKAENIALHKIPIQFQISGTVRNSSGNPLIGVTVKVKNSQVGTTTNAKGHFEIKASKDAILVFSYIGYQDKEVLVNGKEVINVELSIATTGLNQLVVVGYGKEKQKNLTGAVSQIAGKKLENRVLPNIVQGLQGLAPGMNISVTDDGGQPGAHRDFNIRGIGSLSGGSPYVLVDGVPQDLNSVNPNNIANISILKGAAASAIYGARAAFGVILVTTKEGHRDGKITFSYSGNIGWNAPTVLPDMVNSLQYAQTFNQANINGGQAHYFSDAQIQRIKDYMKDPQNTPTTIPDPASPNIWGRNTYANANTDWFNVFYKPWAMNQTHNLNVSGGAKNIDYYISGGYYDQEGQLRYGHDHFRRYNLMSKINLDVTDWLKMDLNAKYYNGNINMPYPYAQIGTYYHQLGKTMPVIPVLDPNGGIMSYVLNYVANGGRNIQDNNKFLGRAAIDIEPAKNWHIKADVSYRLNDNNETAYKKTVYQDHVDNTLYPMVGTYPNDYSSSFYKEAYHTENVYTSYNKALGRHFFKALLGYQVEELKYSSLSGRKTDVLVDNIPSISTATGEKYVDDSKGSWTSEGAFLRLNYNYDERYLLEVDARYDGSSRFPKGKRFGLFPSVSAGYNIAEETFWDSFRDKIGLLKIRASYGSLGNQDVPDYLYINTLGVNTELPWLMNGMRPVYVTAPGLISSDLTWETVTTLDLGVDVSMLQNRLSVSFDWYNRATINMFGPTKTYPGVLGTDPPQKNNADLDTKGFELSIGWNGKIGPVKYFVKAQLADHQTTIKKYRNETGYINDYYPGEKLGNIWGYTTVGIYQTDEDALRGPDQSFFWSKWGAGDVHYKDLNGDGVIDNGEQTLKNHGDLSIIGNSTPRYQYSFDLRLEWKGLYLSALFQGIGKRDLALTGNFFWGISGGQHYTIFKQHLNYWTPDNRDAYYPKPYRTSEAAKNTQVQTGYLQNGAYLRMKNFQLGYTFPATWTNRIKLKNLQVYLSGENLFTVSSIMSAFDPEAIGGSWGNGKLYPIAKTLSVGMNIKF